MYPDSTNRAHKRPAALWLALLASAVVAPIAAQSPLSARIPSLRPDWRQIGGTSVDLSLPALAGGPVERVWFGSDDSSLMARLASGRVFRTADLEKWTEAAALPPPAGSDAVSPRVPEPGAAIRQSRNRPTRLYAIGQSAWRSDDGGLSWVNLTAFRGQSLLGGGLADLAVSPRDADEIVVASATGVWRSADAGSSWDGLNRGLPNLPVQKLLAVPAGMQGTRVLLDRATAENGGPIVEWRPGEKEAWRPSPSAQWQQEVRLRTALSAVSGLSVTAAAMNGSYVYLGSADGWLWASSDRGATWNKQRTGGGEPVEAIAVDPNNPRAAVAAASNQAAGRVFRTTNAGLFWDDLTADLPPGKAHSVAVEWGSGAVYAAADSGVFVTFADLTNPGQLAPWISLQSGLPAAPTVDVRLDDAGNQLYAALQGYGVFAAMAPHRMIQLRLVSAADYQGHAAAPGALLSVLGGKVQSARTGSFSVPVLAASDSESQIQVPFEVTGQAVSLAVDSPSGTLSFGLPLRKAAPAVFIDRDGTPLLLNADTGVLLDAMSPARSGARVQILAAGLGKVKPDWPTGLPAPLENPPAVAVPVQVFVDRAPVEVTRAVLAPGYVGFYLIEVQLPEIVNSGPAELYLEADGQESNRVRIWLTP